jgi:hypothetical protein
VKYVNELSNLGEAILASKSSDSTLAFSHKLSEFQTRSLRVLLADKDGYYAFESALHLFPSRSVPGHIGVVEWNSRDLWKGEYGALIPDNLVFFSEDIFGVQFGLDENSVIEFDPETADIRFVADDVDDWAKLILSDYETITGFPIAHQWQIANGPLPVGTRLSPLTPFVLGGAFDLANIKCSNAVDGMRIRAPIARQIHDLSDNSRISLNVVE